MAAVYDSPRSSTNSTGKVVVAILVATAPFLPAYDKSQTIDHFHNENVIINTIGSTGSGELLQADAVIFHKLTSFAKKFTQEQVSVPPEFNKFFQENFWDLLA